MQLCRDAGHACRKEGKALDSTRPGDVLVLNWLSGRPAAVDVTIRDPLLPSGPLSGAAAFPAWQEKLEHNKVLKYTRQCTTLGWDFIPFLCDVYGGLGKCAHHFIARLAKVQFDNASHQDRRLAEASVWQQLSFSIMKEVGRQLSWALFLTPQGDGEAPAPPLSCRPSGKLLLNSTGPLDLSLIYLIIGL